MRARLLLAFTLLISSAGIAHADEAEFSQCLVGLQQQARQAGVADWLVDEVVPGMAYQARVIELDRSQPEFVKSFGEYFSGRVNDRRVKRGRELYAEHQDFLKQLNNRYGVPGRYLVAFWGLETNFGGYLGNMPTLDSLATLACDPRRSKFFSEQFVTALQMVEKESLKPQDLRGSWAGAMGHTQFMPTTYARYAVDGDGDGRIDLWGSPRDALASGANFLRQLGWQPGSRWGREVRLPDNFDYARARLDNRRTLAEWVEMGVTRADGAALPKLSMNASVLVPAGAEGPAFLVYDNFRVIMGWNRSEFYALSVGHLADRVAGGGTLLRQPPEQAALSRTDVIALQTRLLERGYAAGAADGIFGSGTRRALRQFQEDAGLTADGFPDQETLRRLKLAPGD